MTLHDEILSRPDCAAALALRDCGALAEIISAGRTKVVDLNIGAPATQTQLDTLATAGAIPQAVVDVLKGLALAPDSVTPQEVADAMFNVDGSQK